MICHECDYGRDIKNRNIWIESPTLENLEFGHDYFFKNYICKHFDQFLVQVACSPVLGLDSISAQQWVIVTRIVYYNIFSQQQCHCSKDIFMFISGSPGNVMDEILHCTL